MRDTSQLHPFRPLRGRRTRTSVSRMVEWVGDRGRPRDQIGLDHIVKVLWGLGSPRFLRNNSSATRGVPNYRNGFSWSLRTSRYHYCIETTSTGSFISTGGYGPRTSDPTLPRDVPSHETSRDLLYDPCPTTLGTRRGVRVDGRDVLPPVRPRRLWSSVVDIPGTTHDPEYHELSTPAPNPHYCS